MRQRLGSGSKHTLVHGIECGFCSIWRGACASSGILPESVTFDSKAPSEVCGYAWKRSGKGLSQSWDRK